MKRVFALLTLGMILTTGIIGCEGSAKVGDPDSNGSYKKTTTVTDPNGDKSTKTEVKNY